MIHTFEKWLSFCSIVNLITGTSKLYYLKELSISIYFALLQMCTHRIVPVCSPSLEKHFWKERKPSRHHPNWKETSYTYRSAIFHYAFLVLSVPNSQSNTLTTKSSIHLEKSGSSAFEFHLHLSHLRMCLALCLVLWVDITQHGYTGCVMLSSQRIQGCLISCLIMIYMCLSDIH